MTAIIYAWPTPLSNRDTQATITQLPVRTKYGLQEVIPFEWPNASNANAQRHIAPRVAPLPPENFDPQPTSRLDLPSAKQWSMRLVHGLVEVINGIRPATQLTRWLAPDVMKQVQGHVINFAMPRLAVRSIHVHETDDGVAEVSAVFGTPNRSFALALRLEGLDGRWRATTLIWGMGL